MKALTYHGVHDVRVDTVPDPVIQEPTDAIIRVTSSGICGSDLHLYEVLGAFLDEGDILGHEPMGIVEAVGAGVGNIKPGDRVVIPFNISCGHCFMWTRASSPSARRRRCATGARAGRCSGTRGSTAGCRAARPSSCASPRRTSA